MGEKLRINQELLTTDSAGLSRVETHLFQDYWYSVFVNQESIEDII